MLMLMLMLAPSVAACTGDSRFSTPLVRVDLSDQLPAKARRTALIATPLRCDKELSLAAAGLAPRFALSWKVLDFGSSRFITAIDVRPAGDARLRGANAAKASASVGPLTNAGTAQGPMATAPVTITWSARKGCSEIGATKRVILRADEPSCKRPKAPQLLRPVP